MDEQNIDKSIDAQLLRINEVARLTTLSKSSINLWVSQRKFPRPITLCPTVKVWRLRDILNWIDSQSIQSINESSNGKVEKTTLKIVQG
jgi:predicted DNA-binding transcriptional regulator AlpA